MATLSEGVRRLVGITEKEPASFLREQEISNEVTAFLEKLYKNREYKPTSSERALWVSPIEAAAILSIKHDRTVDRRYIKELARPWHKVNGERVSKKPKLETKRIVGRAHVYELGNVFDIGRIRRPNGEEPRTSKKSA